MIDRMEMLWRRIRRKISRSEWLIDLLGMSRTPSTASEPGLVMIQIDGLSRPQFEKALKKGNIPFMKSLIDDERYEIHSHYPGLPSSTPSVQGELFYGQKTCVPAFSFYDSKCDRIFRMFNPSAAMEMQ